MVISYVDQLISILFVIEVPYNYCQLILLIIVIININLDVALFLCRICLISTISMSKRKSTPMRFTMLLHN